MRQRAGRLILERGVVADVWRNTLLPIPSVFGRLVYLTSLRDSDTGRYQHDGLSQIFGDSEADFALRQSHSQAFSEWLCFDIEQQKADLDLYMSGLQESPKRVLETWRRLRPYRNLVPTSASATDVQLYLADFETLMTLLRNACAAGDSE